MADSPLETCIANQRHCQEEIDRLERDGGPKSDLFGARLGLQDWFREEILLRLEGEYLKCFERLDCPAPRLWPRRSGLLDWQAEERVIRREAGE